MSNTDFKVESNDGLIKLIALNKEAREWIRINFLKPCKIICPPDLDVVMIQLDLLEEVLRSLMAEGYKVNFKKG